MARNSTAPKQAVMPFLVDSVRSEQDSEPSPSSNNSLFQKCLDAWGTEAQVMQAAEECNELALACHHILRVTRYKSLEQLAEEMADVKLMLDQLQYMFNIPSNMLADYRRKKIRKLRRLLKREEDRLQPVSSM